MIHSSFFIVCRWAQEFLSEQNKGLDVLVEYLSHAQSDVPWVPAGCENSGTDDSLAMNYYLSPWLFILYEFFRFDVESVENGGTLPERGKPVERSMEDLTKSSSSSQSHGMTRAARALTVR